MTSRDKALDSACLVATTGSRAYGLHHADSDIDEMGIFVAPTLKVAGLGWNTHKESWTNTSPEGDDLTLHEIGKFLRLVLGGNPTLIELLFMNDYSLLTSAGQRIIDHRNYIISSKTLRKSYFGYAYSQYKRVEADEVFNPKMARHTLRIARQGYDLLTQGGFDVLLENPEEYFALTNLPKEDMLEVIRPEIDKLDTCKSVIREEPDYDTVANLLEEIRKENI